MTRPKKIAIVGAGVAGMALAILATQQGHQVSLFERGSNVSYMGAG
ncbi:MAG TPA: monooxygenase, partial [Erwinia persicina]|nr:monooxygenase [Erwinia persicina]